MIGVRPATVSRNAAKVGGGSPEPLIRILPISAALMARKRARRVRQAIERFIMKNNRFAVGAQLDVAFDGEAAGDRRLAPRASVFSITPFALSCKPRWAIGRSTSQEGALTGLKP